MQITTPREEIQSRSWKLWGFFCSVPKECVCLEAEGLEYCAQHCKSWLLSYEEMKGNELPQEHPLHPSHPGGVGAATLQAGKGGRQVPLRKGGLSSGYPGPCPRRTSPAAATGASRAARNPDPGSGLASQQLLRALCKV